MNPEVVQDQHQDAIGFGVVGRLKFSQIGQMVVNRNVWEAMVKLRASIFQNANAQLPKANLEWKVFQET